MKQITLLPGDKEVLKAICENSAEGYTIQEVRVAIKTIDAIEAATDVLVLDDAYHHYLLTRFNSTKFVKPSLSIIDLYERIQ